MQLAYKYNRPCGDDNDIDKHSYDLSSKPHADNELFAKSYETIAIT